MEKGGHIVRLFFMHAAIRSTVKCDCARAGHDFRQGFCRSHRDFVKSPLLYRKIWIEAPVFIDMCAANDSRRA